MMRWRLAVLLLAGGVLLLLPPSVSARCDGTGATFRCDPIISESLRRKSLGLPNRYTPKSSTRRGKTTVLPGSSYRHRGSWR